MKKPKVFVLTIKHDDEVDSEVILLTRQLTQAEESQLKTAILLYKNSDEYDGDASELLDKTVYKLFNKIIIKVDGYNYVNAESRN